MPSNSPGNGKRGPPKDRQSPIKKSPKKSQTASTTSLDELAAVEGFEETASPTTIERAPTTIESVPTTVESAPTTIESAPVTEVNESSSGASNPHAGKGVIELPASSRVLRECKGKDAEGENSDNSSKDEDADDSDDSELDILPTPVKKPSGIDRLLRGRKIKASSPAGHNYPTRICFDLFFNLLFNLLFDLFID